MADQIKKTTKKTTRRASSGNSTTRKASVIKSRTKVMPTEDQVRARAYEIYLRRGCGPGDPGADWAQAERELTAEMCE